MRAASVARLMGAGLMAAIGLAAAAPASAPELAAIAKIEPGQWQLKAAGSAAAPRTVCIADAEVLIQYGHSTAGCQRFVVANEPNLATVHYTCPGIGHGQTSIKVSTPRSFNLATQGVVNGAPFDDQIEARRIGACPPGATPVR